MPIPPLPDEIIGKIIGFNLQTFSGESEYELRQDRLYSLLGSQGYGMVASIWQNIARREAFRYLDLNISEEKGAARLGKLKEKSMSGTKYAKLVHKLWTTQHDVPGMRLHSIKVKAWVYGLRTEEKLAALDRVKSILKICTHLQEVYVDAVDDELLRQLSRLKELHSLHLEGPVNHLLFGNSTYQFFSLRHLTLNSCADPYSVLVHSIDAFKSHKYNFLLPHYLPSLRSLSLSLICLNFSNFFESFLTYAPRLESLLLNNVILVDPDAKLPCWRHFSDEDTVEALCTKVVSACHNLKHLGLVFRPIELSFKYCSNFPPSTETVYFGYHGSLKLMLSEAFREGLEVNGWSKIFLTRFKVEGAEYERTLFEPVSSWARDKGVEIEDVNCYDNYPAMSSTVSISIDAVLELRMWNAIHLS